jgi:hypothetical protein
MISRIPMTNDNVFLTENRRDVLRGESDWTDDSIRNEKSRIRTRARTALDELIQVAQSEEIDNEDVFEPEKMLVLVATLTKGPGGLDAWTPDDEYRMAVESALNRALYGGGSSESEP